MWKLAHKWATFSHSNKPKRWVIARYFGMFNKSRRDRWVFGDRDSGAYLRKFAWTRIVRHQMVKGAASPDDPALAEYWPTDGARYRPRRSARPTCNSSRSRTVAVRSAAAHSLTPTTCHRAHASGSSGWQPPNRRSSRSLSGSTARRTRPNPVSYTPNAAPCVTPGPATARNFCPPASLRGLLEPDAVKAARPVLRGAGRSNAPGLPARLPVADEAEARL